MKFIIFAYFFTNDRDRNTDEFVEELAGASGTRCDARTEDVTERTDIRYLGIDPTADSLHIGHLRVMMLKHLQRSDTPQPS